MIVNSDSKELYECGVARVDITPPVGIRLIGYAVREGMSNGIDDALTLSILLVRGQESKIAIVALDACIIYLPFATTLRRHIASALGISPTNVLVNFSHTHCSPATDGYLDYDTPEQLDLQKEFRELILERATDACREALSSVRQARIVAGWGVCDANINRRQDSPEHGVLLGEDFDGPVDQTVGVIRIDNLDGTPLAILFRYSCHTVTLGPKTNVFSPDFVGPARRVIESALGCISLFLQGCAGNINPITGIGQDADGDLAVKEDMNRIGHMLGAEALKVAQSLRTHRRRKDPVLVHSVAVYWLYEYEPIPLPPELGQIEAIECDMELPLVPFPEMEDVRQERAEWANKFARAKADNQTEWVLGPLQCFDAWAERRLRAAERGPNPQLVRFPIHIIRLGDIQIVGLPFEVMAETGISLRRRMGRNTFVLGYSNGMISYLPTPEVSKEGGMEADSAYKAYLLPAEVPGDWEPAICNKIVEISSSRSAVEKCAVV